MKSYINSSIQKLKDDMENNRLVIFVGARVSANSGCPSWGTLIDKFAEGLGIDSEDRTESTEYYLKIPQYYYIERGKKEYFDVIEETINSIDPVPNDINRKIFKLRPHTVITTNFDNLLEKTVKSEGLFYTTVRQDTELPYTENEKMIIKMHGDADLKNIVLKEEDYLSYSRNFPLIENYIKGLFSTKTILFVGYSAQDIDFKILFKWVKDNLDGNFQPAYMLEVGGSRDRIEFNYYKDRGINILYYDEIKDIIEQDRIELIDTSITHWKGKRLLWFLDYIVTYDKDKDKDILTKIYNKIKIFEDMNYINKDDIINKLKDVALYRSIFPQTLFFNKNTEIYELLNKYKKLYNECEELEQKYKAALSTEEQEKFIKDKDIKEKQKSELLEGNLLKNIIMILYKSGIRSIGLSYKNVEHINFVEDLDIIQEKNDDEFSELLDEFNYKELNNKLKYYLKTDVNIHGQENNYLKKAYYLYKINNYVDSYEILKKLSLHSLSERNYKYFFIAQFNMKQLRVLIEIDIRLSNNEEYRDNLLQEIDAIDIKETYENLPTRYKEQISFINDLNNFSYFYKKFYKLQVKVNDVEKQKNFISTGGYSYTTSLGEILIEIEDLINYIQKNYIIASHFNDVKDLYLLFIRGIFLSYGLPDESIGGFAICKINKINNFIIQIILKYIKFKDLKRFIEENNIPEIKMDQEEIESLIKILNNILESYKDDIISKFGFENTINFNDVISSILLLLSKTNINQENFNKIINAFNKCIEINILSTDNFDKFIDFIIIGFNEEKYSDVLPILKLLKTYIICLSNEKTIPRYNQVILFKDRFFKQLSIIIKDLDKDTKLTTNRQIKYIIEDILEEINKQGNFNDLLKNMIYCFLFAIYKIVDEDVKKEIENMTREIKSIIQNKPNKKEYIEFMYNALMSNVIVYDSNGQVEFIKDVMDYFGVLENEDSQEDSAVTKIVRGPRDELMRYTVDLIINNKIKYESIANLVQPLKMEFDMFSFFVDKDKFDYTKFEIEWINYLSKNEMKNLLTNNSFARKEIKKLVIEEFKNKSKQIQYMKDDYLDKLLLIMAISDDQAKNNKERKVKKSRQRKNYFGDVKNYRRRVTKKL